MKKFKQLIKTCCMFISVASLVFITINANAQNESPEMCPWCYVPIGSQTVTLSNCTSVQLGTNTTCNHTPQWTTGYRGGSSCGNGSWTYSWAPSTDLSCTTCAQPWIMACSSVGWNRKYVLTVTQTGTRACCPNWDTVTVIWPGGGDCSACRIGHFNTPTVEVANEGIKVFPNPSSGNVIVTFDVINANTSIEVYNMEGKLVMKKPNLVQADKTVNLDLSNVAKGAYFIQVLSNDKGILNKKIIIQ